MAEWICDECCEVFDVPYAVAGKRVTKRPTCPGCGPGTKVSRILPERERYEDDGTGDYEEAIERRMGL